MASWALRPGRNPYEPSRTSGASELRVPPARRLGPACPRTPTSHSAASSRHPWGYGHVGAVAGGTAAPSAVRAAPGDVLPVPARMAPACPHPRLPLRRHVAGERRVRGPAPQAHAPARGTVLRVPVALVPLPSHVPVTCPPMARPWPWFPPEVPLNTGGLCAAGAGGHAVPRLRRSSAALRLPAPFRHRSGSPGSWPPAMRALCSLPQGADDTGARHVPCVGDGSPALRHAGMGRGEARASPGTGPSSSYVPWSHTPPETPPSLPRRYVCRGGMAFRVKQDPRPPGRREVSGPHAPWPTRSHADASPTTFLGSSQGWLPAPAGSPLAGRVLHPLDDTRRFMKLSHLHSPSTGIAWSHCISYPLGRRVCCRYSSRTYGYFVASVRSTCLDTCASFNSCRTFGDRKPLSRPRILRAALGPAVASKARREEFVIYLDHFDLLQTSIN